MQICGNKRKFFHDKESNSHRTYLEHQYGHRPIVLEHQYDLADVMWIRSTLVRNNEKVAVL